MLFATAVSDLSIADALAEPRYRPLFVRLRRRCSRPRRPRPEPFDGFDPDDLEGSIDTPRRVQPPLGEDALGHLPRSRGAQAEDRDGDPRATRRAAVRRTLELIHEIEDGRRICEVANLELLAAYARCEEWEPRLNAVITTLPPGERAPTGPLHGAAVAVKDNIDVRGVVTTNASTVGVAAAGRARRDRRRAAARAGAELLCKTNLLEYAAGSVNPAYGMTFNPRDETRTVGRIEQRLGRARRGRRVRPRARHRHRRLDPHPGRVLRHRRAEADVRPRSASTASSRSRATCDHVGHADAHRRADGALLGVLAGAAASSCARSHGLRLGVLRPPARRPRSSSAGVRARVLEAIDALGAARLRARRRRRARARPCRRRARRDHPQGGVGRPPRAATSARRESYGPGHAGAARARRRDRRRRLSRRARRPRPRRGRLRARLRAGRRARRADGRRMSRRRRTRRSARPRARSRAASPAPTTSPGTPAVSLPCGIAEGNLPAGLQLAAAVGRTSSCSRSPATTKR